MAQVERAQPSFANRNDGYVPGKPFQSLPIDSNGEPDEEEVNWSMEWDESPKQKSAAKPKKPVSKSPFTGLKKKSLKQSAEKDMPPTPLGHEWRETEGGWNLIRCWSEKDSALGKKIKKERYAGYLSRQAWQVMKEHEHEKIIAQIGQQLRRHGGR